MFKFVAVTALSGFISAVDLQEVSQDLAALEDLENDYLEVGLKDLDEIEEFEGKMPDTLAKLRGAACNELKKAFADAKEDLLKMNTSDKFAK